MNIGKEIELTPHTLRRCFATHQANSGMPLPVLRKVLGHSSIRTTALYWKTSPYPQEKVISDKWLAGKIPKEPTKPIENKPKELINVPIIKNHWHIFLNIQQEISIFIQNNPKNSEHKHLELENKLLQEKFKQLEQAKREQEQVIINLKNDKQELEKQLLQVQKKKAALLKLLSVDLKNQYQNLSQLDNKENNQELHQQLIAQIETKLK